MVRPHLVEYQAIVKLIQKLENYYTKIRIASFLKDMRKAILNTKEYAM